MKLIFFILVLLKNGLNPTGGIRLHYSPGRIAISYFYPYFNNFDIICCKYDVYKSWCYQFVNDKGIIDSLYNKRLAIFRHNEVFTVVITKLSVLDAGDYGCGVKGITHTFEYVRVTVSDLKFFSGVYTAPLSPKSSIAPVVWSSSPFTARVPEKQAQKSSVFWTTSLTLAAISVLLFLVMFFTLLLYRLKRKKPTEKSGTCGSSNNTLELNDITYSVVEFRPYQDPCQISANLKIHSTEDTACSLRCKVITEEYVEYANILTSTA